MIRLFVEKMLRTRAPNEPCFFEKACVQIMRGSRRSMSSTSDHPDVTHRLDVLGFHCPVPVSKTRETLERLSAGSVLEVLADDPETLHDMPLLLGRGPHRLLKVETIEGEFKFLIEVMM